MQKRTYRRSSRRRAGFTLIEVLLVVVIIGILVGVAIPRLGGRVRQAEISRTQADIQSIGLALRMYELDNGEYPSSLDALVSNPGARNWNGPYLEGGLPTDPWGNAYVYSRTDNSYSLRSLGPDGVQSDADITN